MDPILTNKEEMCGNVRVGNSLGCIGVLDSARTGLIFTGLQEGAQPGRLTPPGQTEQGIPYPVSSWWVPVGGSGAAGTHSRLGSAQRQSWRVALWVVGFVLCFSPYLYRCCSCSLCLLFC